MEERQDMNLTNADTLDILEHSNGLKGVSPVYLCNIVLGMLTLIQ